jgi:hypothetical protein
MVAMSPWEIRSLLRLFVAQAAPDRFTVVERKERMEQSMQGMLLRRTETFLVVAGRRNHHD